MASIGESVADSSRLKMSSGDREASAISALMSSSMEGTRPLRRERDVLLPRVWRGRCGREAAGWGSGLIWKP